MAPAQISAAGDCERRRTGTDFRGRRLFRARLIGTRRRRYGRYSADHEEYQRSLNSYISEDLFIMAQQVLIADELNNELNINRANVKHWFSTEIRSLQHFTPRPLPPIRISVDDMNEIFPNIKNNG